MAQAEGKEHHLLKKQNQQVKKITVLLGSVGWKLGIFIAIMGLRQLPLLIILSSNVIAKQNAIV